MWTTTQIEKFHNDSTKYIEDNYVNKHVKLDCADLALAYLMDFAHENDLPVTLKYYSSGKWEKYTYKAKQRHFESERAYVKRNFGARNIIDNTDPVNLLDAKAGDLIMSKWQGGSGHTRIIISIKDARKSNAAQVTFYQGNIPAVVPEKKTQKFSDIDFGLITDKRPRRWKFASFK